MGTSCGYPYAMIVQCGGGKLVYLTRYDPVADEYIGHASAAHWSKADWKGLFKTARRVRRQDIIKDWRKPPSATAIKAAAKKAAKIAREAA